MAVLFFFFSPPDHRGITNQLSKGSVTGMAGEDMVGGSGKASALVILDASSSSYRQAQHQEGVC